MNERTARNEGLEFTGIYVRDYQREVAKVEAKKLRDLGYRAVMVESNGGVSVYAERRYAQDKAREYVWHTNQHELKYVTEELEKLQKKQDELVEFFLNNPEQPAKIR